MDQKLRKRLRDRTAALCAALEAETGAGEANERGPAGGPAWAAAMRLGFELACRVRGIAAAPPLLLPFAGPDCPDDLPPARLQQCRDILAECAPAFAAADALGWLHQYWHDGLRQRIAATARTARVPKVTAAEVIPATQVYTEPYMVEFLVHNTLGALWRDMHPDADPAGLRYLARAPGEVAAVPARGPETLTVLDPACGCGNFLLAAFELLYSLYERQGHSGPEEICAAILRNNLYGVDIDRRAVAVCRAALWLKAVEKAPGLAGKDPAALTKNLVAPDGPADPAAAELGSLLRPDRAEQGGSALAGVLSGRYDVVVTNPPYLDKRDYDRRMRDYLRTHYGEGAGNLYAAFILRSLELADHYAGLVTPQTFLFIRSYAALRQKIFAGAAINALAHLGLGAFRDVAVDPVLVVLRKTAPGAGTGVYFKLLDAWPKEQALLEALREHNAGRPSPRVFIRDTAQAAPLPGRPVTYWLGDGLRALLEKAKPLKAYADVVLGMKTSDNRRFVRFWWEVRAAVSGLIRPGWSAYEKEASGYRYGRSAQHAVRWTEAARQYYYSCYSAQLPNRKYWFRPGIVYGLVSSKAFTAKLLPAGQMTDMAASCVFPHEPAAAGLFLALLNSRMYQWLLKLFNPTVNYQPVDLQRLPVPELEKRQAKMLERLAVQAAEAARKLRGQEPADPDYILSPADYLPLTQGLPRVIDGLWRQALILVAARDAIDLRLAEQFALPAAEREAIAAELGPLPSRYPALAGYDAAPAGAEATAGSSGADCSPAAADAARKALGRRYAQGPAPGQLVEDFFEELAREAAIHPVSVYRLLEEGTAGRGWRCTRLAKQLAEDFFSAVALDIMGHRWGGGAATAAPATGIVPLVGGAGLPTMAELIRKRLEPFYSGGAALDTDFFQAVGMSLEDWLLNAFFRRHVLRFRKRPPLWQLSSRQGRGNPAFACLLHHTQAARLRDELRPLLDRLGTGGGLAPAGMDELGAFAARLDGLSDYQPHPDFGIRLNIAPLQAAGLLAAAALPPADLGAALADYRRARQAPEVYLL